MWSSTPLLWKRPSPPLPSQASDSIRLFSPDTRVSGGPNSWLSWRLSFNYSKFAQTVLHKDNNLLYLKWNSPSTSRIYLLFYSIKLSPWEVKGLLKFVCSLDWPIYTHSLEPGPFNHLPLANHPYNCWHKKANVLRAQARKKEKEKRKKEKKTTLNWCISFVSKERNVFSTQLHI